MDVHVCAPPCAYRAYRDLVVRLRAALGPLVVQLCRQTS